MIDIGLLFFLIMFMKCMACIILYFSSLHIL